MKVLFDHAYTDDPKHFFFNKLVKFGFIPSPRITNHPGVNCRFIYFSTGDYLEFLHPLANPYPFPGISFKVDGSLKRYYKNLQAKMPCEFLHRNYDWEKYPDERRPGWNFISFTRLPFRTLYPWFTENEPRPKKFQKPPLRHTNDVQGIHGHQFTINSVGREFFCKILGRSIKDKVVLGEKTTIYFKHGKSNRHEAVILDCRNLERTFQYIPEAQPIRFKSQACLKLANPSKFDRMWDIIIKEES